MLPRSVVWLCRAEAVALLAGAVALLVLSATSRGSLSGAYLAADVVIALLVAALLTVAAGRRRARTPILMVQILAVLISTQIWQSGRHLLALAVGVPALVCGVLIVLAARET